MKKMLLHLSLLAALLAPSLAVVGVAGAVDVVPNCGQGHASQNAPDVCTEIDKTKPNSKGTNNPIVKIIDATIQFVSLVVGFAAVIGILVSSIRFITAGGDANAAASARSGLIYSLIGLVVAVLAQVIVIFVLDKVQ